MVQLVEELPIPPKPSDPPTEFNQKASDVFDALFRAVPQMNTQAQQIEQIGSDADAAKVRAIAEADLALGYRNESRNARDAAGGHAAAAGAERGLAETARTGAQEAQEAAETAQGAAEEARDAAAAHALSMGQAIAMAATFTAVPATFEAWEIVVTAPHLRKMVWSAAQSKYVRAPWHQPCQLFFSYDNPTSIPGALPVRGDVMWNQTDFPDLVERLGLSGEGTFALVEVRGEFLRVLDNGRGVDVGRSVGSEQEDMLKAHTHTVSIWDPAGSSLSYGEGSSSSSMPTRTTSSTGGLETRPRNLAFPLWMTI